MQFVVLCVNIYSNNPRRPILQGAENSRQSKTGASSCMRIFYFRKNLFIWFVCARFKWSTKRISAFHSPTRISVKHEKKEFVPWSNFVSKCGKFQLHWPWFCPFASLIFSTSQLHNRATLANRCERSSWEDQFDSIELNRKMILQFWILTFSPSFSLIRSLVAFGRLIRLLLAAAHTQQSDAIRQTRLFAAEEFTRKANKLFVQHMVLRFFILTHNCGPWK